MNAAPVAVPAIGTAAAPGAQDGVDLLALAALWGSLLLLIRLGLAEPVSAEQLKLLKSQLMP